MHEVGRKRAHTHQRCIYIEQNRIKIEFDKQTQNIIELNLKVPNEMTLIDTSCKRCITVWFSADFVFIAILINLIDIILAQATNTYVRIFVIE